MDNVVCHVVIVGCGLGGLAAAIALRRQGHDVTILEQAAQLKETGAGIQIPPNSALILSSWGLLDAISALSIEPGGLILRAYDNGAVLSDTKIVPRMREAYGVPWLLIHRADYLKVLVQEADRLGVQIRLGCAVTLIDCSAELSIVISSSAGVDIQADVVVGADGLHSRCRGMMMMQGCSEPQELITKGFVHRISVADDAIRAHPEVLELLGTTATNTWMGPGAHVATYPLKGTNMYNFVFICETPLDTLTDMRNYFRAWDLRLVLVLEIAHDLKQWPLNASLGEESWVDRNGNFALMGDACHAMFPYLAQGAAQAVEDGAVLGAVFANLRNKSDMPNRLLLYERLRKPRATKVSKLSAENGQLFHMLNCTTDGGDGRRHECASSFGSAHDNWAEAGFCDWLFGHDVVQEAEGDLRNQQVSLGF